MLKKITLKFLLVCMLFGYTPETRPLIMDTQLFLAICTFGLPGIVVGLAGAGLGYGTYSLIRPLNEKELLSKSSSINQKLEKHNKLFDLMKIEELDEFVVDLKDKKIKNREGLRIFVKDLKSYTKKLTKNKTQLTRILEKKEKNKEAIGVYDIKQAITNNEYNLLKLNDLQYFIEKNKEVILEKLKP